MDSLLVPSAIFETASYLRLIPVVDLTLETQPALKGV